MSNDVSYLDVSDATLGTFQRRGAGLTTWQMLAVVFGATVGAEWIRKPGAWDWLRDRPIAELIPIAAAHGFGWCDDDLWRRERVHVSALVDRLADHLSGGEMPPGWEDRAVDRAVKEGVIPAADPLRGFSPDEIGDGGYTLADGLDHTPA